ncbi:MAG: heme NO-binding domain-containing protein [Amphiplicatus sp.]
MIHKAARDMAVGRYGEDGWRQILAESGLSGEHFISARQYPDEITTRLLAAIGARAGLAPEALLEAFGRHWIKYAGSSAYSSILDRTGGDLVTFLGNLDRMHASIKTVIDRAQLPSFNVEKADAREIEIAYRSVREGLEPFVIGLLKGLLERFGEAGEIDWRREDGTSYFRIARA